jgi:hypothetical protein
MAPKTIAYDLLDIDAAWRAGIASHRSGFPLSANPWLPLPFENPSRKREIRLQSWAFDLGWRESKCLMEARKAKGAA